jgi:uncharacterized protein DUF4301
MISSEVYSHLENAGLRKFEVDRQFKLLTQGVSFINLEKVAEIGNGIQFLSKEEALEYSKIYSKRANKVKIQKFVPASGAATRMFKELAEFAENNVKTNSISSLFNSISNLAFAPLIPAHLTKKEIAKYILKNLGYGNTPKGLIPFHKYKGFTRTPFKEHWIEGLNYAASNGKVQLHFTVSKEHKNAFEKIYKTRIKSFLEEYHLELEIEFSQQHNSTDTIIVDNEGKLLLDDDGLPILRPGGHGALIQNLNSLKADLVFVKNIDNVSHENHLEFTILYKKALAGILLEIKDKIFDQLSSIENNIYQLSTLEDTGSEIMIKKPDEYVGWKDEEKVSFWEEKFNRPLRVCGMVKNEGEPGGGPFWVKDNNCLSLQIIESAQINVSNKRQNSILQSSTHFNPVDLVCYITDYKGNRFDLLDYVDESAAFITEKTVNGKAVNVLEHPGLWNGAMANWNTVFVEVPIETFNPVKSVNDLLKPAHQY